MKLKTGSRGNTPTQYRGGSGTGDTTDEGDDNYEPEPSRKQSLNKDRLQKKSKADKADNNRTRPTNNQLLYKAYFRWQHYPYKTRVGVHNLPTETDACASVTAAFLQVLQTMHRAESTRIGAERNILQILSTNTRRTKVVELSTGTHRVPDELRKHYLSDGENGQYSTNLDRNRYGNDDQYLFTVIRYDLEFLNLCPCMVDVEIIDAKNNHQSIFVSAGPDACVCSKTQEPLFRLDQAPTGSKWAPKQPSAPLNSKKSESPKKSASGVSQLFDALVMAATGATGDEAAPGGEPPVTSKQAATANGHHPPQRQRSRIFSGLSNGEDSFQNAIEAFKKMDMPFSPSFSLLNSVKVEDEAGSEQGDALNGEVSFRRRSRKPRYGSLLNLDSSLVNEPLGRSDIIEEDSDEVEKDGDDEGGQSQEDDSEPVPGQGQGQGIPTIDEDGDEDEPERAKQRELQNRRVRYVARQSSAVNLGTRLAPAELKRLAAECEGLRQRTRELEAENSVLKQQEQGGQLGTAGVDADAIAKLRQLEKEVGQLRSEMQQKDSARRAAEEKLVTANNELAASKTMVNNLIAKLCAILQGGSAGLMVNPMMKLDMGGLPMGFERMAQWLAPHANPAILASAAAGANGFSTQLPIMNHIVPSSLSMTLIQGAQGGTSAAEGNNDMPTMLGGQMGSADAAASLVGLQAFGGLANGLGSQGLPGNVLMMQGLNGLAGLAMPTPAHLNGLAGLKRSADDANLGVGGVEIGRGKKGAFSPPGEAGLMGVSAE